MVRAEHRPGGPTVEDWIALLGAQDFRPVFLNLFKACLLLVFLLLFHISARQNNLIDPIFVQYVL
jgi:hypothetical protein